MNLGLLKGVLKGAVGTATAAGRLTGVIGASDIGIPIKGRKARLVASVGALCTVLLVKFGLPVDIAEALTEVLKTLAE
jgi:hypothetical protein